MLSKSGSSSSDSEECHDSGAEAAGDAFRQVFPHKFTCASEGALRCLNGSGGRTPERPQDIFQNLRLISYYYFANEPTFLPYEEGPSAMGLALEHTRSYVGEVPTLGRAS